MSLTVATVQTSLDTYLGDATTNRISAAQRLDAITEATVWLQELLHNDHMNSTYALKFYDTVHYYKVTTAIASLLTAGDIRKAEGTQADQWSYISPRELAVLIGQNNTGDSFTIERRDSNAYLGIQHTSKFSAHTVTEFDSLTDGGGTWSADAVTSDAANLSIDTVIMKSGSASFKFDVTVAQSSNNRATIRNSTLSAQDFTKYQDVSAFLLWMYLPTTTNFSSVTLYWGTDSSNYWSCTVTTDIDGSAFASADWSRLQFLWSNATKTGTPTITSIGYLRIDLNYTAGFTDATAFRLDQLLIVNPETLTFHYTNWNVGTNSGGTALTQFTATTDIPYFSGRYDQYKYAVAHKATAILFAAPLELPENATTQENLALQALQRAQKLIPSSDIQQSTSFRPKGIRFAKTSGRQGRR